MIPAIQSIAGVPEANPFTPADLPGILYYTQTDDSVAVSGGISSINERLANLAFTQGTAGSRPIENTTILPGHTVWEYNATRRYLSRADTPLAANFNTIPPLTMAVFCKINNTGTRFDILSHTDNITSFANCIRFAASQTNTRAECIVGNGGFTNYQVNGLSIPTTWGLYVATTNGTGGFSFYFDAVLLGSVSSVNVAPTGFTNVVLGMAVSGSSSVVYQGGHFACLGELSVSDQADALDWYNAEFGL